MTNELYTDDSADPTSNSNEQDKYYNHNHSIENYKIHRSLS